MKFWSKWARAAETGALHRALGGCRGLLVALAGAGVVAAHAAPVAPVGHVFVIVLENENASSTFGTDSPAPYLARTLTAQGAYVPNYYGIGHASLDNYIAMVSGQPPNWYTKGDCAIFADFVQLPFVFGTGTSSIPAGMGCVYPSKVKTIADQLTAAGKSWRGYMEDMGRDPKRESATCGHPKVGAIDNTQKAAANDMYATRHNPFVYFHSIIDNQASCDEHVVNLDKLTADLRSVETTPNFSFITPNLCNDGHDGTCADGTSGGMQQADRFLQQLVPQIMQSPAFQKDGLIIITLDEAGDDASACCNEQPGPNVVLAGTTGPGGGKVGAVMLSRFIKPGTVSNVAYNHYGLLKSVEDLFGLDHLGFAAQSGLQGWGVDIFTNASGQ